MKAAVFKGKQRLSVEEVPLPQPGPGQVLVKVRYCAICGSDVHRFQYGQLSAGSVMGHEFCGTIAAVGSGVTAWREGDRVVGGGGTPPTGSPTPLTLAPRYSARTVGFGPGGTPGGYAEYALLQDWNVLAIPDNVSVAAAIDRSAICMLSKCRLSSSSGAELAMFAGHTASGRGAIGPGGMSAALM